MSELAYSSPRWEGDCGYCAALLIPPGMAETCRRCGRVVCAGHSRHHEHFCGVLEREAASARRGSREWIERVGRMQDAGTIPDNSPAQGGDL